MLRFSRRLIATGLRRQPGVLFIATTVTAASSSLKRVVVTASGSRNGYENTNRSWKWAWAAVLPIAYASTQIATTDDEVREPATGLTFPKQLHGCEFVSASVRTVTFLRFKAYAIAFYSDAGVADADNGLFDADLRAMSLADLEKAAGRALDATLKSSATIAMRLRPTGDTVGSHLLAAWIPKVTSRITQNQPAKLSTTHKEALDSLSSIIDPKKKYQKGAPLDVVFSRADGTLTIYHKDEQIGVVHDAVVAQTFFAVYLDQESTLAGMKRDFVRGLHRNWHHAEQSSK